MAINPRLPLDTPELYGNGLDEVRATATGVGRDPAGVAGALLAIHCQVGPERTGRDGERLAFTDNPQAMIDDVGALARRGLEHLAIGGDGVDEAGTIERLERLATDVLAKI